MKTILTILLLLPTNHDTMYKGLEKIANDAIAESGWCGQLTFKRTERFIASGNKLTGNEVEATFKETEPTLITWQPPVERMDGSTDLVIESYELNISCPDYNKTLTFSREEFEHKACGLSGTCSFSLIAIDTLGMRSDPFVVIKGV